MLLSRHTAPRLGDLVTCTGCARTARHARLLALCAACGHLVRRASHATRALLPAAGVRA